MITSRKSIIYIAIIVILYTVGIFVLLNDWIPKFELLTPINLLISLFFIYIYSTKDKNVIQYFIITFVLGFLIEVLGVRTGIIFGSYQYGKTLGLRLWNVPLIMGVNWIITTYSVGVFFNTFFNKLNNISKVVLAAIMLTSIDYCIEPVAMHLDFWQWKNNAIPLNNYLGWFLFSTVIMWFFFKNLSNEKNKISEIVLLMQILFFVILNFKFNV
jgi:uncharacterized membrane protein